MTRLALLIGAAAVGAGGCAGSPPPPEVFDYGWSVRTPAGDEVPLDRYRGRVVVINLWATWCPPCVEELGSIGRLAEALRSTDVAVLAVSPEPPRIVGAFARRHDLPIPLLTEARRAPSTLGPLVLPTTFVVDRAGRIVLRHRGARPWDAPEVVRLVRGLAAEAGEDR